ncbi:NADPH-dependent 7-cyano-7-deazaguanine reductase QueF [Rickettsiales endosymbiont of Stachyamoeba lipophora]|uniref:NADPH-dependent 7-cyano-7-deazaguanine reductase QueF n=1 Tax=Rickettsiales endosymbiont of Stachyamoeba lipophora TaxID=2486578 RepID=UPI000F653A96|nr:NADPH-dependent 7-cyano-7-deazaguanine reductase QueF [Rickettsiales endosymbiont of Stachyamoeba lipophora]AZL15934.1 NADPH-dependent 7-cyano-7-deazaguanine reductase QueF [Rickettsiales endosymbiont of Stachyamoeba lipophora]
MLENSPLGQKTTYQNKYTPALLFPIARIHKRVEIGIDDHHLPFIGYDIWNAYEVSWLNPKGKPIVQLLEIIYPANSKFIIESKSLKLYLNSFNNTSFNSSDEALQTIKQDLEQTLQTRITLNLVDPETKLGIEAPQGTLIDYLEVEITEYFPNPKLLVIKQDITHETVYSNLLKSNCLITSQPDWGTIIIKYHGQQIDHASLLKYIISFRDHNEFHEQCVERIFKDIMDQCDPKILTVYARYTRRGGIDINPVRSNDPQFIIPQNLRLIRQ